MAVGTVGQAVVDFVGEHHDVGLADDVRNGLKLVAVHDGAGRIVRIGENEQLGARRDGGAERLGGQLEAVLDAGRERHGNAAGHLGERRVADEARLGNEHLFAGIDEGADGVVDGLRAADGDENFLVRVVAQLVLAAREGRNLAAQLGKAGRKVWIGAADTFRAAAADQLEIWANRAECEIVRSVEGADPGAVLFDSLAAAKARNVDVVLCDTAGRLHNKVNLMNELSKLRKIIDRETPDAAKETLLVLDATTGQNGLQQAKVFRETAGLTGIILTKLDGTAKGGICVAIAQELGVPVKYVGLGEGIDDLQPFNAEEYVKALI